MLLKISDGLGGFHLFDSVDRIHLISSRKVVRTKEELPQYDDRQQSVINLIQKECFVNGTPVDVGVIEFFQGSSKMTVLFTAMAYVCNNVGDTIERINAKGRS